MTELKKENWKARKQVANIEVIELVILCIFAGLSWGWLHWGKGIGW